MNQQKKYRALVGILDWGLGHATRSVPIIKKLLERKFEVILIAENRAKAFLEIEFPELKIIEIPAYNIKYPNRGSMILRMLLSIPHILKSKKKEHKELQKIIKDYKIDVVISDNRYGLWSSKVPSVIITHQLNMQVPKIVYIIKPLIDNTIRRFINKFDKIWIPDFKEGFRLSGKLCETKRVTSKKKFIGALSRFEQESKDTNYKYDILVMLSGPEPQRTVLEKKILEQTKNTNFKIALLLGKTEKAIQNEDSGNITIFTHLKTEELQELIIQSKIIVSRSGYSTIMDLLKLNKRAFFIPTPGQTEQEYLAKYYTNNKIFAYSAQRDFNINKVFNDFNDFTPKKIIFAPELLDQAINDLLSSV